MAKNINISELGGQRIKALGFVFLPIWCALSFTIIILIFVANQVSSQGIPPEPAPPGIEMAFNVISVMLLLAAFFLGRRATSEEFLRSALHKALPTSNAMIVLNEKMPEKEARLFFAINASLIQWIISMALSEATTILGFILAMMTHTPDAMYPFALGSAIVNFSLMPQRESIPTKAQRVLEMAPALT